MCELVQRYREAYKDLRESVKLQPGQTTALQYMTTCLYHMRRFEDMVSIFKSILKIDPDNSDALKGLAHTYR